MHQSLKIHRRLRAFTLVELPAVSKGKRTAFTLVELLVVIGIIAVLISVLLPTLGEARKQAAKTKCAAALGQIGYAFQMYAIDNQGWYPPSQLEPSSTSGIVYNVNGTDYPNSNVGAYWYNFLEKYVTKTKNGVEAQNAGETQDARTKSIFWGCPAWDGYQSTSVAGGINIVQTGYGMTMWPTFTPSLPPAGVKYPSPNSQNTNYIEHWGETSVTGQFFKEVVYGRMGAQRCLVADSRSWGVDSQLGAIQCGHRRAAEYSEFDQLHQLRWRPVLWRPDLD